MRVKLTGPQSEVMRPILADYPSAEVKATVLVVPDDDAAQVLSILREGHASHTGDVGERRALAIAVRKLEEAITGAESDAEGTDTDGAWPCTHDDCDEVTESEDALSAHVADQHPGADELSGWLPPTGDLGSTDDHDPDTCPECAATTHESRLERTRQAAARHAAANDGVPERLAAVLRAIEEGNYGNPAKRAVRETKRRDDESGTRWVARVRHALYTASADRAGDALQLVPGGS